MFVVTLMLAMASLLGSPGSGTAQGEFTPTPPPPPSPPALLNVSGTWSVTRTWFRQCPACSFPVIRTTTWVIFQDGNHLRVDRGLRGTIQGYQIELHGTETDGHDKYYLAYHSLYVGPDGQTITGGFAGNETIQNPCDASPPRVTCFVHTGYLYAVRISPVPTQPPIPTLLPTVSLTPTRPAPTVMPSPPVPAETATATSTPVPTPVRVISTWRRFLPLIRQPAAPTP